MVTITSYDEHIVVFKSLQSPKKITYVDQNGRRRSFLVKANDDLRKDQRVMEVFNLLIKYNLKIRKYVVVPISSKLGIIEWIHGLISLKSICMTGQNKQVATEIFKKYKKKLGKHFSTFNSRTKSVLAGWYNDTYKDPVHWHTAKHCYAKTLAIMSAFGYFIGLGDRHCENILVDTRTGDVVHVDLNLLFGRASMLSVPERVPFRLTKNVRECLGVLRETGKFRLYVRGTIRTIVRFRDVIEANLLAFVYDPVAEIRRPGEMIKTFFSKLEGDDLVDRLIKEAVDDGNLGEMYVGWMPFI
ncbi:protein kinase of the PI-3 kinase family [Trachipleistophora hominis]|uniref:Protein kinase of the PI-3 kinase family n=1 Tax=Trachipleistophora hominis TaxID=72359 RepID=L7JZL1_TRAHO|nr:protein kinase of the PI-3 kinase family [Trachipleistophora hominis]